MLVSLLGYFFYMVTALGAVMGLLIGFFNVNSALEKGHSPRPAMVHTVAADAAEPWGSPVASETSPAKDVSPVISVPNADAKESATHKPKVLPHQRNNYGYGNEYAYRNEPKGLFIH